MLTGAVPSFVLTGAVPSFVLTGAGESSVLTGAWESSVLTGAVPSFVLTGAGESSVLTGAGESSVLTEAGESSVLTGVGAGSVDTQYEVQCCCRHLHFWQNDQDPLRATAVTRGWNGYGNKTQHRKLTVEQKLLPPLLRELEAGTFRSMVWGSNCSQ